MASINVLTLVMELECAAEIYTKQTTLSEDYQLFLCKYIYHTLMF